MQLNVANILKLILAVVAFAVCVYLPFQKSKTPLLYSFWCFQLLILLWAISASDSYLTRVLPANLVYIINYLPWSFGGAVWLFFSAHYVNFKLKNSFSLMILILPFLDTLSYILNFTGLLRSLLSQVSMISSVCFIFAGIFLLIKFSNKQTKRQKKQVRTIIVFILLLSVSDIFWEYYPKNLEKLEAPLNTLFTVIIFLLMLFFTIAIFRFRFLNIVPLAFRTVVDNIDDSIIVVDSFNRIIYYNDTFMHTFPQCGKTRYNDDINCITNELMQNMRQTALDRNTFATLEDRTAINTSGELALLKPEKRFFSVNIQPLPTSKIKSLARIISFTDISEHKYLQEQLSKKNSALTQLNEELRVRNEQLKACTATVEELVIARERNRLADEVHSTLGRTLSDLVTQLDCTRRSCREEPAATELKIRAALEITREGLQEIKRSLTGFLSDQFDTSNLLSVLRILVADYQESGMQIKLTINQEHPQLGFSIIDTIYHISHEALNNSLRHGKATEVDIMLIFHQEKIKLFIFDNGLGAKDFQAGPGLIAIGQRVSILGGSFIYGSDGEKGFNIHIEIPYGERNLNG